MTSDGDRRMANGDGREEKQDSEQQSLKLHRGAVRALIEDFDPIWFSVAMNAGIIGIIMHQFPYQFNGLPVLSTIAFMIDLVIFTLGSIIYLLHFALYRRQAINELTGDVSALGLLACWPISLLTLTAFVTLNVSEAYWGGYRWMLLAYSMFWIGAAWTVGTLVFVFLVLMIKHDISNRDLPPLLFIPAVGVATVSTVGGLLSSYAAYMTARLAVPIIIFSFFTLGIGLVMALLLYGYILHRLLVKGFPPPEQTAAIFCLVGPMGQSSTALQLLGNAASAAGRFGAYNRGTFLTAQAAQPLQVSCVLLAMLLSGMGVLWLIFSFAAMGYRASRRELKWTPAWNSIVFPTGTFTTSMLEFGVVMASPTFDVVTAILLVFLVVMFFVNVGFTIWEVGKGRLLVVKENPRVGKRRVE